MHVYYVNHKKAEIITARKKMWHSHARIHGEGRGSWGLDLHEKRLFFTFILNIYTCFFSINYIIF